MLTLFLVVENAIHEESLSVRLRASGFAIAAAVGIGENCISAIGDVAPDVVLLDLPAAQGLPLLRALRYSCLRGPGVVVLGHAGEEAELWRWMHEGASGLVLATESLHELVGTIEAVAGGIPRYPSAVRNEYRQRLAPVPTRLGEVPPSILLSGREREIVSLIDRGLSNKEISDTLGIRLSTVKNHVHHLLTKLKAHRRSEAAARVAGRRQSG